jgi:hypothetical protein
MAGASVGAPVSRGNSDMAAKFQARAVVQASTAPRPGQRAALQVTTPAAVRWDGRPLEGFRLHGRCRFGGWHLDNEANKPGRAIGGIDQPADDEHQAAWRQITLRVRRAVGAKRLHRRYFELPIVAAGAGDGDVVPDQERLGKNPSSPTTPVLAAD